MGPRRFSTKTEKVNSNNHKLDSKNMHHFNAKAWHAGLHGVITYRGDGSEFSVMNNHKDKRMWQMPLAMESLFYRTIHR